MNRDADRFLCLGPSIPCQDDPHHIREKNKFSNAASEVQYAHLLQAFCEEGDEVSKSEIAFGYKLKGHDYLVFDKEEIDSAKPVSGKLIELDKFIEFFQVDPHYFES